MQNNKKKQKVKNKGQWISILIFLLIGAACGVLIMLYLKQPGNGGWVDRKQDKGDSTLVVKAAGVGGVSAFK